MGYWKTARGLGGDRWADLFDNMMHELAAAGPERNPDDGPYRFTMQELADLVEFCSRGHLVVEVRHPEDAGRPLALLHSNGVETYPNRGQIHWAEAILSLPRRRMPYAQQPTERLLREGP